MLHFRDQLAECAEHDQVALRALVFTRGPVLEVPGRRLFMSHQSQISETIDGGMAETGILEVCPRILNAGAPEMMHSDLGGNPQETSAEIAISILAELVRIERLIGSFNVNPVAAS